MSEKRYDYLILGNSTAGVAASRHRRATRRLDAWSPTSRTMLLLRR